jgi:putative membrane protein
MYWNYGWGMGFGWIFMAIFWVLVIVGIVYLIKLAAGRSGKEEKEANVLDILKKRYARGEVTKEEFDRIKDDLMK